MADSVEKPVTRGDLRASKGAYLFIPDGTKRYLRVDLEVSAPEGFLRQQAEAVLCQTVKTFIETDRFKTAISPEHGIPERLCGTLKGKHNDYWILETEGIEILIDLPEEPSRGTAQVFCEMDGPLRARQLRFL